VWTPRMDKASRDRFYQTWKKAVTRSFDWTEY
jgi:glycerol kinase